ncbi:MAG: hypothetical protein GX066_01145 [Clostridiaceae bacterium]|nr:hypothetical protein [Clostridiaceae bacterium]
MSTADRQPKCINCKRGKQIPLTSDVLCPFHGVVSVNYVCKRYSYNWFLSRPKRKRSINTSDFSLSSFSIVD